MLRERSTIIINLHRFLDISLTVAAFVSAYFIKLYLLPKSMRGLTTEPNYYEVLFLIIMVWYLCFTYFKLYESYRKRTLATVMLQVIKAVTAGMVIMVLILYIVKIFNVSRLLLFLFYIINIALLAFAESSIFFFLRKYRRNGFNYRNILIVGSKEKAKNLILKINAHAETGYRVIGCLEISDSDVGKEVIEGVKIIGTLENVRDVILKEVIDGVVFTIPLKKFSDIRPYLIAIEEVGVDVVYIPDLYLDRLTYRSVTGRVQLQPFFGNFAITLSSMIPNTDARSIKNAIDYLAASIGLFLLSPLFAIITIAIKISSKGPVFYMQERSGLNGRTFLFYKFRTMAADADTKRKELENLNESDGPVFKIRNDPRIIPILGHFLRKTSLDELPQLINIFRGQMSLVGPRPPIPAEVMKYEPWQRRRLSMKPGLTCIWQTSPHRNDISFNEWMKLDLEYIDNWSLWLDMKLLLKTFKVVFFGDGR